MLRRVIYLANIVEYVSCMTAGLELEMAEVIMFFGVALFHRSQPGDL